jgi:hypothetical protein
MWASKLALRIIQFALAVAIIGCVGAILSPGLWTIYPLLVILPQVSLPPLLSGLCFSSGPCTGHTNNVLSGPVPPRPHLSISPKVPTN